MFRDHTGQHGDCFTTLQLHAPQLDPELVLHSLWTGFPCVQVGFLQVLKFPETLLVGGPAMIKFPQV